MSTRSVIALETPGENGGWTGVYHHFDGYPSGVGAQLFELAKSHFAGDLDALVKSVITDRPGGWSHLDGDWTRGPVAHQSGDDDGERPTYYDDDPSEPIKATDGTGWLDYAYVINPAQGTMTIYRARASVWHFVATVALTGTEPDWDTLD